jgi:hypothetical protein
MSTEPAKEPPLWQIVVVALATAYGLWQLLFPGPEAPSSALFWMRAIFTTLGVVFLVVFGLRRLR